MDFEVPIAPPSAVDDAVRGTLAAYTRRPRSRQAPSGILAMATQPHAGRPRRLAGSPAAGEEPIARELVIRGKACEAIPMIVDGIDARIVGAPEIPLQLQIIGRIGKNEIDAFGRQLVKLGDAVAAHDLD